MTERSRLPARAQLARLGQLLEAIDRQITAAGMALMGGLPRAERVLASLEAQRLLLERRYDELEARIR